MKNILLTALAITVATCTQAWAADPAQHDAHHPAGSASAPKAKAMPANAKAAMSMPAMAQVDVQMKSMQAMHDKMMAAKTPEERTALMPEQMKTMQDSMAMMHGMAAGGMSGMPGNPAMPTQMMGKRMDMMESMMQMMMDRQGPATMPAN